MIVLAACILIWLSTVEAGRKSLPRYHVAFLLTVAYVAGLIGARLLFVLEHYSAYANPMEVALSPVPGGFAMHGGFFFATLVAFLYARWFRLPLGKVVDSTVIGLCLFGTLARLGCFLSGCCYGRPNLLPWGVVFPQGSEAAARWGFGVPVHPTQIYEAGYLICIAILFSLNEKHHKFAGEKFLWLVLAYSAARFLNEFVRGDPRPEFWNLNAPQWMSLALVAISLGWMGIVRGSVAIPWRPSRRPLAWRRG